MNCSFGELFDSIPIVCCVLLFFVGIFLLYVVFDHTFLVKTFLGILFIVIVSVSCFYSYYIEIYKGAISRGAELSDRYSLFLSDFDELSKINEFVPVDEGVKAYRAFQLGDISANDVFVFYRYDCPSCRVLIKDIADYYSKLGKNVYWCCSRGCGGKVLLKELDKKGCKVVSVPSVVYYNGDNNFTSFELESEDGNGNSVFNPPPVPII